MKKAFLLVLVAFVVLGCSKDSKDKESSDELSNTKWDYVFKNDPYTIERHLYFENNSKAKIILTTTQTSGVEGTYTYDFPNVYIKAKDIPDVLTLKMNGSKNKLTVVNAETPTFFEKRVGDIKIYTVANLFSIKEKLTKSTWVNVNNKNQDLLFTTETDCHIGFKDGSGILKVSYTYSYPNITIDNSIAEIKDNGVYLVYKGEKYVRVN